MVGYAHIFWEFYKNMLYMYSQSNTEEFSLDSLGTLENKIVWV